MCPSPSRGVIGLSITLILVVAAGLVGYHWLTTPHRPGHFRGRLDTNKAYDGDTFWFADQKVKFRLWGIDAFETKQECTDFKDGKPWRCGLEAAKAFYALVKNDTITCDRRSYDRRYQRMVVVCWVRGIEINQWLVEHGWALAYVEYTKHYLPAQRKAEAEKAGAHGYLFVPPKDWRRERKR